MARLEEILETITCVDAGAAGGLNELSTLKKFLAVNSFEPLPGSYNLLKNSAGLSGSFKIHHAFPFALYSNTGKAVLHSANRPSMSSLLEFDAFSFDKYFGYASGSAAWKQMLTEKETVEIDTITLDEWSAKNGIDQIDFLKLDTQGTELEIMNGAEKLLENRRILVIKTEFSNFPVYKNQCLFSDIDLFLKAKGFELAACLFYPDTTEQTGKTSGNANGRLREIPPVGAGGDAIYVLRSEYLNKKNVLKAGIILSSLGQYSIGSYALLNAGLNKNEVDQLMVQVSPHKPFRKKLKEFIPPVFVKVIKKFR